MFTPGYRSLDGLEKPELEDMRSAIVKIENAIADNKRRKKTKKRGKARADPIHEHALKSLLETVKNWQLRGNLGTTSPQYVTTNSALSLQDDAAARTRLRKLYRQLSSWQNPIQGHTEEWTEQLEDYAAQLLSYLPPIATADDVDLWAPENVQPLAMPGKHIKFTSKQTI
jgi:hypothetical protein